jgi:NAD(P)-dependent dehydrogenase (short-subunit alcohol dehydrogenase family)
MPGPTWAHDEDTDHRAAGNFGGYGPRNRHPHTGGRMSTSLLGLEEKVAVVTGGGGNIGRATAIMLAQAGTHVVAVDVDGEQAEKTAVEASALGAKAVAFQGDARRPSDIESMVSTALQYWDRLDVGVNIVGGGPTGQSILEMSEDVWQESVETNLYSAVRCSRAFARTMIARNTAGSIINIASPAGLRAAPSMAAYGAGKAALINFTWTLAVEVAATGIRANVVVPAFVPRPGITFGGTPDEQAALAKRVVPMGRVTKAEDVAGAIICFASNLTSYSTGQMIVCDGGRMLTNPINPGVGTSS